ncbi:FtsH-interacting integral membrane protein [Azospira oryzae PS]|uniref:FtsH-interacting integral membrane protein n=1 Tax=Azospira oryzae (strain ATCC BAA-33 / DSM 13638 / PS) TaxID=640081 RepID=G8QKR7_AZOOP|nr:Bax inhibitor-1 family protein [Azospira oryzae]AEV24455.1 FtsH-interacting integral membrane protein [Azospira oryzae PS]
MLDTLYGKTFLILTIQLALTWASTFLFILWLRQRYYARAAWVGGSPLESGELDLELDWQAVAPWFWLLLGVDVAVFLLLLFVGQHHLAIGLPLFCLWSLLTGIELALALVSVDENLGGKVLALTAMLTFAAFLVGAYAGIDFSFLGSTLFAGLTLVLLGGLYRLLFSISDGWRRLLALFGCAVFVGYLVFDFNRLTRSPRNDWEKALDLAISLYLDIINLFLHLLDLLHR